MTAPRNDPQPLKSNLAKTEPSTHDKALAERHVSRQLRLAYLAPKVLKRLVYKRDVTATTVMQLTECALLSWKEQEVWVFGEAG